MHHFHFCPNPACTYHQHAPKAQWFVAAGFYATKAFGKVQRFRCSFCGKYFSGLLQFLSKAQRNNSFSHKLLEIFLQYFS